MTIFVLSAMSLSMRIGCTCSSIVTLVAGCGIIFPLIGPGARRFSSVSSMQDQDYKHPFFFEVMLTAAWNIWILRNGRTFRGENATFAAWKCNFVHDIALLAHRLKVDIRAKLSAWVNSLI